MAGFNDRTICVDFDGVIHKYSKGYWTGEIYDEPMEGAREVLWKWRNKGYRVVIFTARDPLQHQDIKDWLLEWDLPELEVTNVKIPAFMYLDDRAIRFVHWEDAKNYVP